MYAMAKQEDRMTPTDHVAARNLREIWDRIARERRGLTQARAAEELGMSEGAVSQYLRGKLPLGLKTTYRWAAYLGVDPKEIRPDMDELVGAVSSITGKRQPRTDDKLLGQALAEVEEVLNSLGIELTPQEKGRLVAIAYDEAIETGEINRDVIRGMARFAG